MTGVNAIGGAVNYVTAQPTTGPVQNEVDLSLDSYGSYVTHFGSGGSTPVKALDYRFDLSGSQLNSFVDGDYRDLTDFSGQLNYHLTNNFMVFGAVSPKGIPVMPTGARP